MGKPIPITSSQIIDRLQESMGKPREKRSPKLSDYAKKLIDTDPNIREGSRDGYEHVLRNHLEGTALGGMAISAITAADVREFWSQIKPKKAGPAGGRGVQANVYQLLAKVFSQAINDGLIQNSPLSRSGIRKPPKRRASEVIPLTVDQIEALAAATTNERDRLMVLFGGYVGLRAGEVGGLRVRDLDAVRCRLTVAQAVIEEAREQWEGVDDEGGLATPEGGEGEHPDASDRRPPRSVRGLGPEQGLGGEHLLEADEPVPVWDGREEEEVVGAWHRSRRSGSATPASVKGRPRRNT